MKKRYLAILVLVYVAGYCDWLQPGFLKLGVPASWDKPLSTKTTYDLAAGIEDTAKCTALKTIPDWAKPANWQFWRPDQEPKTCKQRLKEKRDER